MPRDLNFPNASPGFLAMNAHLLGGAGMRKAPAPDLAKQAWQKKITLAVSEPPSLVPLLQGGPCSFTIPGAPMGAPRQSRCDAWRPRPVVLRYRDFKDKARECAPAEMTQTPTEVHVVAFFPVPESWSKKKKAAMVGQFHRVKPDGDNVFKGAADALWEQDSCIAVSRVEKRWCLPGEERLEITILP